MPLFNPHPSSPFFFLAAFLLLMACSEQENPSHVVDSSRSSIGDSLKRNGLYQEAVNHYQKDLYGVKVTENPILYVTALCGLIETQLLTLETSESSLLLDSAFSFVKERLPKDTSSLISLVVLKAEYLYIAQQYEEAIRLLEENTLLLKHGSSEIQMRYYMTLGALYRFGRTNYSVAEKHLGTALNLIQTLHPSSIYWPRLYYRLAATVRLKGDYDLAITYGTIMLNKIHQLPALDSALVRQAHSILANSYSSKEKYALAIQYYDSSLYYQSKNQNNKTLSTILSNRAFAQQQLHRYIEAIRTYQRAAALLKTSGITNLSDIHLNMAYLFRITKAYDSSFYYYRKCKTYREKFYTSPSPEKSILYYRYAALLHELHQLDSGIFYVQKALSEITKEKITSITADPSLPSLIDLSGVADILFLKGALLKNRYSLTKSSNDLSVSVASYQLANAILQENAKQFIYEGSQLINISHSWQNAVGGLDAFYEYYLVNPHAHFKDVYSYITNTKTQLLLSRMDKQSLEEAYLPDSLVTQLRFLRSEIGYWQAQQAITSTVTDKVRVAQKQDSVNTQYTFLMKVITEHFPAYATFRSDSSDQFNTLVSHLKETRKTIIEYSWGKEYVYALLMSADENRFVCLSDTQSILTSIDSLMNHLKYPSLDHHLYAKVSHSLFLKLLQPLLSDQLPQNLTLIADHELLTVPFEALLASYSTKEKGYHELDYLLHHTNISYALSAKALLKKDESDRHEISGTLAMAYGEMLQTQHSLPNSKKEIDILKSFNDGIFLSDATCTKANFLKHSPQANLIHLAVHGLADTSNRFTSKLTFPAMETEPDSSESLYAYELYRQHIPASLVVLTSCESGAGSYEKGEGVFGISRGFLAAGSKSVIQSLWTLQDQASLKLIEKFYHELATGKTFSEALSRAKKKSIQEGDQYTAHPAYWAGLVFMGQDSTILLTKNIVTNKLLVYLLAGVILALLLWYYKRSQW